MANNVVLLLLTKGSLVPEILPIERRNRSVIVRENSFVVKVANIIEWSKGYRV